MLLFAFWACARPSDPVAEARSDAAAPVALPASLAALSLPVAPGVVSRVTDHVLQVDYAADSDAAALSARWSEAMTRAGFTVGKPESSELATTWELDRGQDHPWTMAIVRIRGRVEVHLNGTWSL